MSRKVSYFRQVVKTLEDLHKIYPMYSMGRHLSTALDGCGDVWGMSDKELAFLLDKYKTRMDLDIPHIEDSKELEKIMREGMDLDNIFMEEENGDY